MWGDFCDFCCDLCGALQRFIYFGRIRLYGTPRHHYEPYHLRLAGLVRVYAEPRTRRGFSLVKGGVRYMGAIFETAEQLLASVVSEEDGHYYLGDYEISPQSVSDIKSQIIEVDGRYEFSSGVLDPMGP